MVALTAVASVALTINAEETDIDSETKLERSFMRHFEDLTDEEKAEREAKREEMQAEREARREQRQAAIEEGYDAFMDLVGTNDPILEELSEDEFPTFQEAHELMENARGLMDQAQEKLESIGINRGFGERGMMHGWKKGGFGGRGMFNPSMGEDSEA